MPRQTFSIFVVLSGLALLALIGCQSSTPAEADECDAYPEGSADYEECERLEYEYAGSAEPDKNRNATPTAIIVSGPDEPTRIIIHMEAPVGQYQSGTATLRPLGDKTEIVVSVRPPEPNAQPMHLHTGDCSKGGLGTVVSVLQDVVNGESTTVLDKPLEEVVKTSKVVNVHKSAAEISTYTACGVIPDLPR
jgi:hypothetical protein